MTLFHLREFWSTTCGNEEEFDKNSICIANIDNSADGFDKIVIGSFNGILRIYKVELNHMEMKNEQNLFQISDLLLEVDFKLPILQIASGCLLTSSHIQLAVLHPTKLSVYSISSTSGITDHGTSYNILLIYELNLNNKAANMLIGSMGQTKGKDIICVQNTNCIFGFYENESLSFSYNWNKDSSSSVLSEKFPMEFTYISDRDLIILVDELFTIQCFQYQELAMNSNVNSEINEKNCVADWSYSFGEFVFDMQAVHLDRWYIVILGQRNLCVLRDDGSLFFVKKFDVNPSCLYAFANDNKDSLIILIGTQMCNMLVYQNDILRWATKIPFVPIAIRRANLNNITGSIVLLSDQGHLAVGYLGTNPSLKIISIPPLEDNSEKIEEELKQFKRMINFENDQQTDPENKLSDCISINIINCQNNESNYLNLVVEIIPMITFPKIKLLFHKNDFYEIIPNEEIIYNLNNPFKMEIQVKFNQLLPLNNKIKCSIICSSENTLRIITKKNHIPFENLIKLVASSSGNSKYSFKINIQKMLEEKFQLVNLFEEILNANHSTNSFSFCLNNYEQIQTTIKMIISEKNICYLVESNDFTGLYVSVKELFKRIKLKSTTNFKIISLALNFNPMENFRRHIKNRMENKKNYLKHKNEIAKFSQHHRVLQKRILVKSKDKTPASLDNLQKLLNLVQKRIIKNIDKIIFYDKMIAINNYHLWTNLNILKLILKKSLKTQKKTAERFIKLITVHQLSDFTLDWEELFQSSLHEIFEMRDIGNVVKMIEQDSNLNADHLADLMNELFRQLQTNNDFLPIEFVL